MQQQAGGQGRATAGGCDGPAAGGKGRGARRRENSVSVVVNEAGEEQRVSVRGVGGPRGAPVMVPPRLVAS